MSRVLIIFMLISFLFSCKEKRKEEIEIDPDIKCLSAFIFGSRSDTIRRFAFTAYLFKRDSFLVLRPDSLYHWKVMAARLDSTDIRSLNKMFKIMDFKSYEKNTICKEIRENHVMYCGPSYGFADSRGNVETFIPFGKEKVIENLFSYLRDKESVITNDTSEIINYMERIKRKYLKDCPHFMPKEVSFEPPINQ